VHIFRMMINKFNRPMAKIMEIFLNNYLIIQKCQFIIYQCQLMSRFDRINRYVGQNKWKIEIKIWTRTVSIG